MAIFRVHTYTVKTEKISDLMALFKEFEAFVKKRPDLFKEMKSWHVYSKLAGGKLGEFIEMAEFENLGAFERLHEAVARDKEYTTKYAELLQLVVPGSYQREIWSSVAGS
jgi:hypothetical protein